MNVASSRRGSDATAQGESPRSPTNGGRSRRSRMRATAASPSRWTQIAKKQRGRSQPFAGRLKSSQSRSWPRPPSETVPVPIPPSGNAISLSAKPVNCRACAAPAPVVLDVLDAVVARGVVVVAIMVLLARGHRCTPDGGGVPREQRVRPARRRACLGQEERAEGGGMARPCDDESAARAGDAGY